MRINIMLFTLYEPKSCVCSAFPKGKHLRQTLTKGTFQQNRAGVAPSLILHTVKKEVNYVLMICFKYDWNKYKARTSVTECKLQN